MATPEGGYCIQCGERLAPEHRFCWACGAERWTPAPPAPPEVERLPPARAGQPPADQPVPGLAWIYAAGAVLWLLLLAQTAGVLVASPTRAQLMGDLARAGYTGQAAVALAVAEGAAMLLVTLVAAAVHGVAFYGLRGRRPWGWVAAVLIAGAWSLVLVGIPVLRLLLRPATRRAYGVR